LIWSLEGEAHGSWFPKLVTPRLPFWGHDGWVDDAADTLPKPHELLALHSATEELFTMLQRWFNVPASVAINLSSIDAAVTEMGDPVLIMAMAMRKLQALNLLSTPGVRTTTDVVITIVQDLDRALVQAPNMRLGVAASTTDWDAAFASIDSLDGGNESAPAQAVDDDDLEATRFRQLHGQLHDAVYAVMEASDGEIRYFV
jgi:hypothetical protein